MQQGKKEHPRSRKRTVGHLTMISEAPDTGVVLLDADMQED